MANKKGFGSNVNAKMVNDAINYKKSSKKGFGSGSYDGMVNDATNFGKSSKSTKGWESRRVGEINKATNGAFKAPKKGGNNKAK